MSFNKYFAPDPQRMMDVLENGVQKFFNRKIDAIIGNPTSIEMINWAGQLLHLEVSELEIIESLKDKFKDELREKDSTL